MGSPYRWRYTLRWPYYYLQPSTKQHTDLVAHPLSHDFHLARRDETLRLMFFGDMMPMRHGRVPRVDPALKELLSSADLIIGNCEAPITDISKSRLIVFQMGEDFLRRFLEELGISPRHCILSIANNHIGDQGQEGLSASLERLRNIGVTPVGHHGTTESQPITKVARNGLTLGIAAWTHWLNRDVFGSTTGVWRVQDAMKQPWLDMKKAEGIDCLIGTPHWEYEFQHFPRNETRVLAQNLIESGFDILVGHHPHVLQPVEWLGRRLCLYSIGNLNGPSSPFISWPVRLVCIFEIRLSTYAPNRGHVASYALHPFVQNTIGNEISIVPLEKAPQHLRKRLKDRLGLLFQTQ